MRENRLSGSEGGRAELFVPPYPYPNASCLGERYRRTGFLARAGPKTAWEGRPSAPVKVENRRGASPRREEVWLLVAEGNCVAARRGGEQPEANDPSVTQVNSIRPVTLASLLANGEAQVTPQTSQEE